MSDSTRSMRLRIAVGGIILLLVGGAWYYLISFPPR